MKYSTKFSELIRKAIGIVQQRLTEVNAYAIYLGQQPVLNADNTLSLADLTMPITRKMEMIIAEIAVFLTPKHRKIEGQVILTHAKERDAKLEEKVREEDRHLNLEAHTQSDLLKSGVRCLIWLLSAISLYFGELGFLRDSLQLIAPTRVDALKYAIGFCSTLIIISHGIPVLINRYLSKPWLRKSARVLIFIMVICIFYGLGTWRSQYLIGMGKSAPPSWQFAVINFGYFVAFYTVAQLLLIPYSPQLWSACKKLWRGYRRNRFNNLREKGKIIAGQVLSAILKFLLDIKAIRHMIQKGYDHAIELFKSAYLKRHGTLPPGEVPPLDFSPLDDGGE